MTTFINQYWRDLLLLEIAGAAQVEDDEQELGVVMNAVVDWQTQ